MGRGSRRAPRRPPAAGVQGLIQAQPLAQLIQRYAGRIADTSEAKAALVTILAAAEDDEMEAHLVGGTLPDHLESAYQTLFDQAGLGLGGATAAPGSDQQAFAPTRIISEWTSAAGEPAQPAADGHPGLLGGGSKRNIKTHCSCRCASSRSGP